MEPAVVRAWAHAAFLALLVSLGLTETNASESREIPKEETAMPDQPEEVGRSEATIEAVRSRNESRLMAIEGVVGIGVGRTAGGDDAIVVYLRDESARQRVPARIEGYPLEIVVTGGIDAQR